MSEEDTTARIYGQTSTKHGKVELTVRGNEDETSEEIAETFDERLDNLIDAQEDLAEEDDPKREVA